MRTKTQITQALTAPSPDVIRKIQRGEAAA